MNDEQSQPISPYDYPLTTDNGLIICQLCGKELKVLTAKHTKKCRDITVAQYKIMFPEAPVSGDQYKAAQRNRKDRVSVFQDKVDNSTPPVSIQDDLDESIGDNDPIVDEIDALPGAFQFDKEVQPEVEPIDMNMETDILFKLDKKIGDIPSNKFKLYQKLCDDFPNLKLNYIIFRNLPNGVQEFSFITDMADPVRKIDFEFPKTYWHNVDPLDPARDQKLEEDGWKVIRLDGLSPTYEKVLEKLNSLGIQNKR